MVKFRRFIYPESQVVYLIDRVRQATSGIAADLISMKAIHLHTTFILSARYTITEPKLFIARRLSLGKTITSLSIFHHFHHHNPVPRITLGPNILGQQYIKGQGVGSIVLGYGHMSRDSDRCTPHLKDLSALAWKWRCRFLGVLAEKPFEITGDIR
jgi:hypothetical protein